MSSGCHHLLDQASLFRPAQSVSVLFLLYHLEFIPLTNDEPAGPPNGGRRMTRICLGRSSSLTGSRGIVLRPATAGKSANQVMNHSQKFVAISFCL
jgi:hypothetical protein